MSPRRIAFGFAALVSACAPPPPPPVAPTPPAPPAAASAPAPTAAPPGDPLPAPLPPRAPLPTAEPLTEPLPPLDRRFSTMTLPGVKGVLIAVDGRSDREVWFVSNQDRPGKYNKYMTESGVAVRFDGKKVVQQLTPDCYGGMFSGISAQGKGIVMLGYNPYVRAPPREFAYLPEGKGAKWSCANAFTTVAATRAGERWSLSCDSPEGRGCELRGEGGQRGSFPAHHASFGADGANTPLQPVTWEMRGSADGWMVLPDEFGRSELLRYNGVTWVSVASLGALAINSLWLDEEGRAFLTAEGTLLRHDGRAFTAIPVPPDFAPGRMVGRSGRDLWFFGPGKVIHHWDGHRLQRGEAPFDVGGAWAAPGGEVWIVGVGDYEGDAKVPPGLVGHAPAVAEVR